MTGADAGLLVSGFLLFLAIGYTVVGPERLERIVGRWL